MLVRESDREPDRDTTSSTDFLTDAERERDPGANADGIVRDRQAMQLRERLRDAEENVRDLPTGESERPGEDTD